VLARTPLRVKLVAALIGLLVLGLAITGVAAWVTMRNYLVGQVDRQLQSNASAIAAQLLPAVAGANLTQAACDNNPRRGPTSYYVQVTNSTGTLGCAPTDGSAHATPAFPRLTDDEADARRGEPFTVGSVNGSQRWRTMVYAAPGGSGFVYVAISLDQVEHTLGQLLLIEVVGGLAVVVLLGAVGYVVVRGSLRPLVEVEDAAHDIAAGDLTRRVPDLDPRTEVGSLSASFNTMLARVEDSFHEREASEAAARRSEERMRRFVADASHELRTPLTSIRGFAELYRQGAVPGTVEVGRVMRRIEDQATRMGILVEDLLLLARLDQQRPLDLQPVDLVAVAGEAVHDAQLLDPVRPVRLELDGDGGAPVVLGDETRLRQVVGNLMSNALVHTPPGSPVTVRVGIDDRMGRLDVVDEGPGMSAQDAAHVFERFYRADASRARASGGTGLGLAIASALVTAHSGTLTVETEPGRGSTFTVRVPLAGSESLPSAADVPGEVLSGGPEGA
jgi:two-component system OmpR family sensor kinase